VKKLIISAAAFVGLMGLAVAITTVICKTWETTNI